MTTAFLPCRAGSERVAQKNTRPFAGYPGGLLELKLRQLNSVCGLDRVIVSSNDDRVLRIAAELDAELQVRIEPRARPEQHGGSASSMQAFIREYVSILDVTGTFLWAHVTHPLMTSAAYAAVLRRYDERDPRRHDSLVTTTRVQEFLWRDARPFNYDPSTELWPRTQDLVPLSLINHAAYVIDFSILRSVGDRVGERPLLVDIKAEHALDIDWPDDFEFANEIVSSRRGLAAPSEPRRSVL